MKKMSATEFWMSRKLDYIIMRTMDFINSIPPENLPLEVEDEQNI